ncbi:class I adenylate-forming enzyme family protein [Lysobacter yananisis]|uniref:Class I adenylate-forming enzyme family protein n=1 Tax=Lysobacter yananisis TaxID=1003114 RepID=A0ABY9PEG6_9GAMM|nr:class I adenylate-forming enzyme family protein [Lysobacter yananisis]WMT05329.1 class I adenylate-forming enzyme family protein [Lysobacter yananisis]
MNAVERARRTGRDWTQALADSASVVRLGGESISAKDLLARGRAGWRAHAACSFPALRGIGDVDMLSLLLAAVVDRRPVLLCAADATPPAMCDGSIGAAAEARATDAPGERASATGERERCPDGLAVLSSGTLGTPKTIWHDPRDLLATAALVMRRLALGADDRVLVTVPLHHMYGLGAALIPALLAGAQVHLLPKANLLSFNDALRAAAPSWVYSTPHLLRTLVQRKQTAISPPCSLVLAGDGIPEPLRAQAQLVFQRVFDLYGSSELGVIAISGPNQPRALHPLDGVRAFAAEAGAEQTRLLVRHPHAATHIAQTDAPIALPQAWDTGDIAIFHDEGGFAIQGRADLSLNRAGKLLVLADLERAIMAWPGVDLAVAIALDEDSAAGKAIAVVIQPSSPALTVDALKQHAADTLPVFARPDRYALAAELPRLSSGKPDRNTITKDYRHG